MREIQLTQGKTALVPNSWYQRLMQGPKWYAHKNRKTFYAKRNVRRADGIQTIELMHRLILGLKPGDPGPDHKDGNGLNNQLYNLRSATHSQNMMSRGMFKNNTSGIRGVSLLRGKYQAKITVNGNQMYLGIFTSKDNAEQVRIKAEFKYHKEFSSIRSRGIPPEQPMAA